MNRFEFKPSALHQRQVKTVLFTAVLSSFLFGQAINAQSMGQRYALLISGLGGTEEHRVKFHQYLGDTREILINRFGFLEKNIIVLADTRPEEETFINDISNAENIRTAFSDLSGKMTKEDDLFVILFGHGSWDGRNAVLNIPRQDLKDIEYAELLAGLDARRIIFINTASSSGPFAEVLSAPNRVIITATRSGGERLETVFPLYFVSALRESSADLDKNGELTLLEVFDYASQSTLKYYTGKEELATEHALLEDSGDRVGTRIEELTGSDEGQLANTVYLLRPASLLTAAATDSTTMWLLQERDLVNNKIYQLRSEKESYQEYIYFRRLEPLFVRLARINDELEKLEVGGGE